MDHPDDAHCLSAGRTVGLGTHSCCLSADMVHPDLVKVALDEAATASLVVPEKEPAAAALHLDDTTLWHVVRLRKLVRIILYCTKKEKKQGKLGWER